MPCRQCSFRGGFTLLETVVSIAVIGLLAAILLPAVQSARESARKTQCQNNLKQMALALHAFHDAHGVLPSPYNGTSLVPPLTERDMFHMHSWRAVLLPYLERSALHDSIDWQLLATDLENAAVATTPVSDYLCPSGSTPTASLNRGFPHPTQDHDYLVVRSDYDALAGIWVLPEVMPPRGRNGDTQYARWSLWGTPTFDDGLISGNLTRYDPGRFRDVSDGLSNTLLVVERGGRPLHLVDGRPHVTDQNPQAEYFGQAGWSASNTFNFRIHYPNLGINQDNHHGIYSDHVGGAYVSRADGSVTFLSESIDLETLATIIGRSDGEP